VLGPTTKDLADAAGVSLATVDRVINDRPNVSSKTRAKVQDAIQRIGFVKNMVAVNLLRNRPYRFKFVLPASGDQYLEEILKQVDRANHVLRADMTVVDTLQLDMGDPHCVANYLAGITLDTLDGVAIMAPETPPVRDALTRLNERGVHVVQFLSGQEKQDDMDFVGINNFAAGATAGRLLGRFATGRRGPVMVISETMQSQDSIERRHGFDQIINGRYKTLMPLPSIETHGSATRAARVIERQLAYFEDIVAVYVMSSESRMPLKILRKHPKFQDLVIIVHERTPFSEDAIKRDEIDAIIAQNPGHAVRSALRTLRARSEEREPIREQEHIRIDVLLAENL